MRWIGKSCRLAVFGDKGRRNAESRTFPAIINKKTGNLERPMLQVFIENRFDLKIKHCYISAGSGTTPFWGAILTKKKRRRPLSPPGGREGEIEREEGKREREREGARERERKRARELEEERERGSERDRGRGAEEERERDAASP